MDLYTDLDHLADMPDSHSSPSFDSSESPEPARTFCTHDDEDDYVHKEVISRLQKLDPAHEPRFFGGSRSVLVNTNARKHLMPSSSGYRLIQTALDFKSQYIGQSVGDNKVVKVANIFNPRRRDEFWDTSSVSHLFNSWRFIFMLLSSICSGRWGSWMRSST